jgi:ribosomal protein L3 glutamine methyltransferase
MNEEDHDCACGDEHEHEVGPLAELVTVRDWLRYAVTRFNRAGIFCGHGVADVFDEAVWLILATLSLPLKRLDPFLDACIPGDEREKLFHNIERRALDRVPTAYLVNEAWLGDFRFYVDQRVIVPRSLFAELLGQRFAPWVENPEMITSALDLCTGSGCLAIVMAEAFPNADIVAVDSSSAALAVAARNLAEHGLSESIELVESDLFAGLGERLFDLIVCNPPYVTAAAMEKLPREYLHEPRMALAAGEDGMEIVRRLIGEAARHLYPEGIIAVEVGYNRSLVESVFPDLPFTWLSTRNCADGVFLLHSRDLPRSTDGAPA